MKKTLLVIMLLQLIGCGGGGGIPPASGDTCGDMSTSTYKITWNPVVDSRLTGYKVYWNNGIVDKSSNNMGVISNLATWIPSDYGITNCSMVNFGITALGIESGNVVESNMSQPIPLYIL